MNSYEILFCPKCSDKIDSNYLKNFWQDLCVYYVSECDHPKYSYKNLNHQKCLSILENKGYIVSTDIKDHIYAIPKGVIPESESACLVCICGN